jgi:Tol biopolymer transport system component
MNRANLNKIKWLPLVLLLLLFNGKLFSAPDNETAFGEILFVSDRDGNNEIYVMNADGSNQRNLTQNAANDYFPMWSPDGSKIVFASNRDSSNEIYLMDNNGGNLVNLTNHPANDSYPSWSPDGNSIAFLRDTIREGIRSEIYIMDTNGENIRQIAVAHFSNMSLLSWSPNSKQIMFFSEQYGLGNNGQSEWETVVVDVETAQSIVLDLFRGYSVLWSPDGQKIMFGDCGIFTAKNIESKSSLFPDENIFKVSDDNFLCVRPYSWSPDGTKILFSVSFRGYNEDNQAGLYIMDADQSDIHQITQEDIAYDAKWSPNGKHVVYVSESQIYVVDIETESVSTLTAKPGTNENPAWRFQPIPEAS